MNGSQEEYLSYLRGVRNLSELTVHAYREDLSRWSVFLSEEGLTELEADDQTARAFTARLSRNGMAPASVNRTVSGLRGYYRFLVREGTLAANPFSEIRSMKKRGHLPSFLFEREMEALLAFEPADFWALRDKLILEVLYSTGCRITELVEMNIDRMDRARGKVLVRGKGNKERFVFLGRAARAVLGDYLDKRGLHVCPDDPDARQAVFLNRKGRRITQRGAAFLLQKHLLRSGIVKHVSPHTFRHTFATHILDRGADIRIVQELLGHASLSTTQVYTHLGIQRLIDIHAQAHPHGRKRTDPAPEKEGKQ